MQATAKGRVFGLARVSSEGQTEGTSLDAQDEAFRAYCRLVGLPSPDVRVEVESGGPAAQERRVEVERIIREAQPGDIILVTKVDRWSRNLPWSVGEVRKLVARGVGWRSLLEGIDATTQQGDGALGIMSWVADQERIRIRERTVGSRHRLRALGFHVEGHAPLGYRAEGGRGQWKLVPDESTVTVLREHFALAIDGMSTRAIADELRRRYPGATWLDHAAVARRIADRRYLGESNTRGSKAKRKPIGEWVKTHEALVDADTWHRAQSALQGRRRGGRPLTGTARTASFLLRGLLHCAYCGSVLASYWPKAAHAAGRSGYYMCRHRGAGRDGAERCERGPIVPQVDADARVAAQALERLESMASLLARPAKRRPPPAKDPAAEVARLVRKRDRVVRAVADETLTPEEARTTLRELAAEIEAAEARRVAAAKPPEVERGALLGQVDALRRGWSVMTVDERRHALQLLADRIEARSAADIAVTWHQWNGVV